MDYKAQYRELVNELERLGGDLRGVPRYYSLEAEAKVRRLIKERSAQPTCAPESQIAPTSGEPPQKSGEPAKKADFIADYPVALHGVYRAKQEAWLRACSLKLTLNAIPMEDEVKACEIQRQLWQLFETMDNYDVVLQYWRDHKKILEPVQEDYSRLTPMELVQRRNTLRSNIVSREKSLAKWEEQAKSEEGMTVRSLWVLNEKIARKREEVEQMKLQVKEIEALINANND
ncbi:hypothetical protein [Capnocytophaga gingivalis]|uniref:hypothetical protein n=1 Tax=Capnocytophaga gingivalis TaxID=1017 RepID=UPI0023F7A960|nr:hypothetical protein [Capnocytophaga gingivalis]